MKSRKLFKSINTSTIIYFAVLIGIYLPLILTHQLNFNNFAYVLFLTTAGYIVATRKWYYIQVALSLLIFGFTVNFLSALFYQVAFKDASFIMSSIILAYFFVLFITTLSTHAEWTIRSAWVGLIFGLFAAIVTEVILIAGLMLNNEYVVGLDGLFITVIVAFLYLSVGKSVKVNVPNEFLDVNQDKFQTDMNNIGYKVKKNKKHELIIYDETEDSKSYRIKFIEDKIITQSGELKPKNKFLLVKNDKEKTLYPWLLQQASLSFEVRGPKPVKSEQFIIVNVAEVTSGVKLHQIDIPHSSKHYEVAIITIAKSEINTKLDSLIERATSSLDTTEN